MYLWLSAQTSTTGRRLASSLGINCGYCPPVDESLIINWGGKVGDWTNKRIRRLKSLTYLNSPFEIVTNKYQQLGVMRNDGVKVPDFWLKNERIQYPSIGRTFHHQGGSNFHMIFNESDRQEHLTCVDYFIRYIPNKKEYRIHIIGEECVRISKKVATENADEYCHSNDKGWHFSHKRMRDKYIPMVELAKKAVKALNMDFGGVDILVGEDDKLYVLEVNTGCGLGEMGVDIYGEKLEALLNEKADM